MSNWPPLTHQDVQDAVTARAVIADIGTAGTATGNALKAAYAPLGQPPGVTALTSKAPSGLPSEVLRPWYAAIANRDNARANVVLLGDSITAGQGASTYANGYSRRLAKILRQRLGLPIGGTGFVPAGNAGVTGYTWPASPSTSIPSNTDYGLSRNILNFQNAGDSVTFTVTGDSADIITLGNFGTISWKVDGGAATNISGGPGSPTPYLTHISLGSAGQHTVTVTSVSAGGGFIDGLIVYNGDYASGVTVHDAGHYGWATVQWSGGSTGSGNWPASVAAMNPGVVGICLGTNDIGFPLTAAQFQTNLTSVIADIRAALTAPLPPFVLVALPAPAAYASGTWQPFIDAMNNVAAADSSVLVADLSLRLPGGAVDTLGLHAADGLHFTNKGHAVIADALASFLLPA